MLLVLSKSSKMLKDLLLATLRWLHVSSSVMALC